MSNERPNQREDGDLDETQAIQRTRGMNPVPDASAGRTRPAPPPNRPPAPQPRPGSARYRRDNGLYLPLWSIVVMLLLVFALTAGIVLLVIALGENRANPVINAQGTTLPPTQPAPVLIVSSPIPTERPAQFPASPATATLPPEFDPALNEGLFQAPPDFSLAGPTLPPIEISPTPISITLGASVVVVDVGDQQLNVRDEAGVFGTNIVFRADEGETFVIQDGPLQIDNFTWWQISDPFNADRVGWAASQYLLTIPPQS